MPKKLRKKLSPGWIALLIFMGLADLILVIVYLSRGKNIALFNPKGAIAQQQYELLIFTVGLLLIFAIPTVFMLYYFAWKYRENNTKSNYSPEFQTRKSVVIVLWLLPAMFIFTLAAVMWPVTHKLTPQNNIAATNETLTIKVISMRWKWLFLYPEQQIATVNYVQFPENTPVQFEMTADETPMSSFWIPNLGGQLYTMTSHQNRLNLIADTRGDYPGSTPEINGAGFAGMKFNARVSTLDDFNAWVTEINSSQNVLDYEQYAKMLTPSQNNPPAYYSAYAGNIYSNVLAKYGDSSGGHVHY